VEYWLLTGQKVFESATIAALMVAQASQEPVPPGRRADVEVPADLERVVLDCLVKDPQSRVQSAEEVAERLTRIEPARPWSQERAEIWWTERRDNEA